ncbi:hypothetical protein MLD38_026994 [Melastoma candidum]|uniref:Uncharacterized protein n=1 Tax=Melastoma candidum TaxID=119954 RepID=A0ACB9P0B8_9MYRT|nr:hypothetical protein MLD38_026994 [Melastoma candidum]
MSRGMQSTIYVEMSPEPEVTMDDLYRQLKVSYEFVKLLPAGVVPHTRYVRGSNYCLMNIFPGSHSRKSNHNICPHGVNSFKCVLCPMPIDNLVKGASGQALQNLNLMMGFPEITGLHYLPLFP